VLALAPLLAGCGMGRRAWAAPGEPAVAVRKDLTYFAGPAGEEKRHQIDLYLPEEKKEFPMLLFIHGGAWRFGVKDIYGYLGRALAARGIGVAVANYRLSPGVQHPEHVRDVARAFAWVAKHARELGADEKRLYLAGHSAGGHLVALLALDPRYLKAEGLNTDRIRGVIGISGPYALGPRLFPEVFGADEEKRADAFPLNHVRDQPGKNLPPFLLLYAEKDYAGLPALAQALQAALVKQGAASVLKEIPDRDHITIIGRVGSPDDLTTKMIVDFVKP
jgi:acetyl esterase/lipase